MTLNNTPNNVNDEQKRVAIVGGGITGLSAAWHLIVNGNDTTSNTTLTTTQSKYNVQLFEANSKLGGHADTFTIQEEEEVEGGGRKKSVDVDLGFMVYNSANYPNLVQFFKALKVESEDSDMSLSVSLDANDNNKNDTKKMVTKCIEWSSRNGLSGLLAGSPFQIVNPSFLRFLYDLRRFNNNASSILTLHKNDPRRQVRMKQYLKDEHYSNDFAIYYLIPVTAALWSASMDDVLSFPAYELISFLCNHKMLQLFNRPEWKTVSNRSHTYVQKIEECCFTKNTENATCHLSTPITSCQVRYISSEDGDSQKKMMKMYELFTTKTTSTNSNDDASRSLGLFHHVIFACHAPVAADILNHSSMNDCDSKVDNSIINSEDHDNNTTNNSNNNNTSIPKLISTLRNIKYSSNDIYLHSDTTLMPLSKNAWSSWNCLGFKNRILNVLNGDDGTDANENDKNKKDAMEGGQSGFGNIQKVVDNKGEVEEKKGRMDAVYITYHLNRLQNLDTSNDYFVTLNPPTPPNDALIHHHWKTGHPQFTPESTLARDQILQFNRQKKRQYAHENNEYDDDSSSSGLWFCGAWSGYGFHEDGCRSGFEVATLISDVALPWCNGDVDDDNNQVAEKGENNENKNDVENHYVMNTQMVLSPPNLTQSINQKSNRGRKMCGGGGVFINYVYQLITHKIPVTICKWMIHSFLNKSIQKGTMILKNVDGLEVARFGQEVGINNNINKDSQDQHEQQPVTVRIFDDWFYVRVATSYDLGLARSYMSGYFNVEPLSSANHYDSVMKPPHSTNECTKVLGDPVGLTRLFLLFVGNRDNGDVDKKKIIARNSANAHKQSNPLMDATGLVLGKMGSFVNYIIYKIKMDNSERGGSLRNIHAHYDLSNDLFRTFLDKETLMYSSAIYDAVQVPTSLPPITIPSTSSSSSTVVCPSSSGMGGLAFRGTLEEAEIRKLDTLLSRAQIQRGQNVLDIGFGWGGLSIAAAKNYGCHVTGITLSVEQKALAQARVDKLGLQKLITFEVIDYRTFCRKKENAYKFDRVLSCEMIEAVGHNHLGDFFGAVERVLRPDGVLVMEAITTPESRYEAYRRSTDFINTIVFPGSCCPSLHALIDASYQQSTLTLEHIDNIGLHYAETLREWRRRFNANEDIVRSLGFDDVFLRVWNYYLTYCEAGFSSQTENCLILVFSRPGCKALVPLSETRSVTQLPGFTMEEVKDWIGEE